MLDIKTPKSKTWKKPGSLGTTKIWKNILELLKSTQMSSSFKLKTTFWLRIGARKIWKKSIIKQSDLSFSTPSKKPKKWKKL